MSACSCIGMRKSWQSRPRHVQQCNPQPADALHELCAIHTVSSFDGAALDASEMARNVCRDLVFEASSHDACSHSDLGGCADGTAEALPARQTASIRCWHAPMQLSGLPRVFVHALAFSSTPSHANAAEFWSTPSQCHCSCTRSVCSTQPAASHHSPRVCNCLTVVAPRHGEAAPHRAFMGINRCPVERPVEHTCVQHLAPLATDYWAASHSFIEPRIVTLAGIFEK
jgi:hypothetical protein